MTEIIDPKLSTIIDFSQSDDMSRATRNRVAIMAAYTAQAAGDLGAVARLMHPDVRFLEADSLPFGWASEGVEGLSAGMRKMFNAWSEIEARFLQVAAAGDRVFVYFNFRARSVDTGELYERPCVEVFTFDDAGQIIELRIFYWDTHEVRAVCGMP